MASAEALKQAAQTVLHYHFRRDSSSGISIQEAGMLLSFVAVGIVGILMSITTYFIPGILVAFVGIVGFAVYIASSLSAFDVRLKRNKAANALRQYNQAVHLLTHSTDPEAIGPLCEILWLPDITAYVPESLQKALLRLQPSHNSLLNSTQSDNLIRVLTQPDPNHLPLQRATIKALSNIGDVKWLPVLEQLASGALGATDFPELKEEARRALLALQERVDPGYMGRHLLRASDLPEVSSEELLRPTTNHSETAPQELLRAQNAS